MKIIGGSFGLTGKASLVKDGSIKIKGAKTVTYPGSEVILVNAKQIKERKFGVVGFIIGSVILGAIGIIYFGVVGLAIGVLISLAGSFYSKKQNIVSLTFKDEKQIELECTKSESEALALLG